MSDRESMDDLKITVARGLSAMKVLLEERGSQQEKIVQTVEKIQEKLALMQADIAKLTERVDGVKERQADQTGRFSVDGQVVAEVKKQVVEEKKLVVEEKKLGVEKWKATAPIIVAIVTAFSSLIVGIINLIR